MLENMRAAVAAAKTEQERKAVYAQYKDEVVKHLQDQINVITDGSLGKDPVDYETCTAKLRELYSLSFGAYLAAMFKHPAIKAFIASKPDTVNPKLFEVVKAIKAELDSEKTEEEKAAVLDQYKALYKDIVAKRINDSYDSAMKLPSNFEDMMKRMKDIYSLPYEDTMEIIMQSPLAKMKK